MSAIFKMDLRELEAFDAPDLVIAGLRIWIHGRQFPNAVDYWDGNWLRITAYCIYPHSVVRSHGTILHLGEVVGLLRECEQLYKTLQGGASLRCIEPNLGVELTAKTGGRIAVQLSITPDHMSESHTFTDRFDQTYLPPIIAACNAILEKFPVREPEVLPR